MNDKTVEQIAELAQKITIKFGKPVYGDSVFEMDLKGLSEGRRAKLPDDRWIQWRIKNFNEMLMGAVPLVEQMATLAGVELPINCDKMKSERYFIQQEGTPMSDIIKEEEAKVAHTPLASVQAWLGRAKVEALRDDVTKNYGMILHLVGKSADRAREMGSGLFTDRAHSIFKVYTSLPTSGRADFHAKYMKEFEAEHFPST